MRCTVAIDGLVTSRSTCERKLSVTPGALGDVAQRQAARLAEGADPDAQLQLGDHRCLRTTVRADDASFAASAA